MAGRIPWPGQSANLEEPAIDSSLPLLEQIRSQGGVPGRLRERARTLGRRSALFGGRNGRYGRLAYEDLLGEVDALAAGLKQIGVQRGDKIGLVSENFDLWLVSDLALLSLGAVDVPRGGDAPESEVAFCLSHAECTGAIVESRKDLEKLGSIRDRLAFVLILRGEAEEGCISFAQVRDMGIAALAGDRDLVEREVAAISHDDLATIIYTSGTTGNPKGVMLSHGNLLHNICVIPSILTLPEGGRYISFLPSWHTFERTIEYVALDHGMEIHYSSKWHLKQDLPRVRPHFLVGVPRLWETFMSSVSGKVNDARGLGGSLVRGALNGSRQRTECLRRLRRLDVREDGVVPRTGPVQKAGDLLLMLLLSLPHWLADRLVYRKLRSALGGNVQVAVSGGGPLPHHVDEFLTRARVPLLNGYGLTESSPVISVRRPGCNRLHTIGPPVELTEVRIVGEAGETLPPGQKGVIQARGPQIMRGYYANSEATRNAVDPEGWLNTGDIGMLSTEGDILITGRAKDTIVLRGGENIEPEPIEAFLCSSPLIAECMLVGHGEKVLGVLVVPDLATARRALGIQDETSDGEILELPALRARIAAEIAERVSSKNGYRSYERIGRLHIIDKPFSVEDGTLTATMKKKRAVIEDRYQDVIRCLYADDG